MENLKIDRSKLKTISNYAKDYGKTRQTIHNWIKEGKLKLITIDGVQFVYLK